MTYNDYYDDVSDLVLDVDTCTCYYKDGSVWIGDLNKEHPPHFLLRYENDGEILHRLDGPAMEYSDGDKEYYVDGCWCKNENNIIDTICKITKKEELLEYLLTESRGIRLFAEFKLKELESVE